MANIITLIRLCLMVFLLYVAFLNSKFWVWTWFILGFVMFHLDILDGWIARRFNCSTAFGAMFDVATDRITEISLWVILAYLHWVPIWVPIVFIIRGHLVDMLRLEAIAKSQETYSRIGYFIVKGAFVRTLYGLVKGWTVGWIAIMRIIQVVYPALWQRHVVLYLLINNIMVYASVALCLIRAVPIYINFFATKEKIKSHQID